MRLPACLLLMWLPIATLAQSPQGMNEADMQNMMQKMQEMQACMEKIDKTELKRFEQRSYQLEADVKSLCASGKRSAAQDKAMTFSKEMINSDAMKTMRKCTAGLKEMMPKIPFADQDVDYSSRHVCDHL